MRSHDVAGLFALTLCITFTSPRARAETRSGPAAIGPAPRAATAVESEVETADARRVALLVELTPLVFRMSSTENPSLALDQTSVVWGSPTLGVGVDVRLIAGLQAGLGVSYLVGWGRSRVEMTVPGSTLRTTSTQSGFSTTPRLGYRLPLGSDVALVPRVGFRFTHTTSHTSTSGDGTAVGLNANYAQVQDSSSTATWGTLGGLLEVGLAASIFVAVGPELAIRLDGSFEQSANNVPVTAERTNVDALELALVAGIGARF